MRWAKRSTHPTLLTVIVCKVARCHVSNAKIVDFGANQPKLELPYVKLRGYHSRARSVCAQATEIQEVQIRKHIKVSSFCIKTLTSLRSKRFSVSCDVFTPLIDFPSSLNILILFKIVPKM